MIESFAEADKLIRVAEKEAPPISQALDWQTICADNMQIFLDKGMGLIELQARLADIPRRGVIPIDDIVDLQKCFFI